MRVKGASVSNKKRKKLFTITKGYWGQHKNAYRRAREAYLAALSRAYADRKRKKREHKDNLGNANRRSRRSKLTALLRPRLVKRDRRYALSAQFRIHRIAIGDFNSRLGHLAVGGSICDFEFHTSFILFQPPLYHLTSVPAQLTTT